MVLMSAKMLTLSTGILLILTMKFSPSEGFNKVTTEQEASSLRPRKLLIQILTEPESLIRLFEGLNISFQMLRHLGRTGPALIRLPFDKEFLSNQYDHMGLDYRKRPYYARMPTMFSHEAPRYVKMLNSGNQNQIDFNRFQLPMRF